MTAFAKIGFASLATVLFGCGPDNGTGTPHLPDLVMAASSTDGPQSFPDASGPPATGHVVYLNFGGQGITAGAADDPVNNVSLTATHDGTIRAWQQGFADQKMSEDDITSSLIGVLAPYNIRIVTTRPATPGYDMIVFGGFASAIVDGVADDTTFSIAPNDCSTTSPNVGFIFDVAWLDAIDIADNAVAMIGLVNDIPATVDNGDCMCFSGSTCDFIAKPCTFGKNAQITTAHPQCENAAGRFDEAARFLMTFGAHP